MICPVAGGGGGRGGGGEANDYLGLGIDLDHHRHLIATHDARPPAEQALFGIYRAAEYPHLREECACALRAMDFDGYAIGGVSVGEPEVEMYKAIDATVPHRRSIRCGSDGFRGQPHQMVELVARGVDIFDCVLPTRVARHARLYARRNAESARGAVPAGGRAPAGTGVAVMPSKL